MQTIPPFKIKTADGTIYVVRQVPRSDSFAQLTTNEGYKVTEKAGCPGVYQIMDLDFLEATLV